MDIHATDKIGSMLTTFLDVQSRRSEIVAGNIANADTPGYQARELDFGECLEQAAVNAISRPPRGGAAAASAPNPRIVFENGPAGIDGNDVDAQREMATLSDAGMQYLAGVQMLQSRLRTLRAAIREGR